MNLSEKIKQHCKEGMSFLEASAAKEEFDSGHWHWCKGYSTALQDLSILVDIWAKDNPPGRGRGE